MSNKNLFHFSQSLKNFAKSTAILTISAGIFGFNFANLQVKASTGSKYMIVTEPRGVNIRNQNCEVVDSLGFGQIVEYVFTRVDPNLRCKVVGKDLVMANYRNINGGNYDTNHSYIASDYLSAVIDGNPFRGGEFEPNKASVISGKYGANLRDSASCSRVMTIPNGTKMEVSGIGGLAVCQVGQEFYLMQRANYQGKTYFVADILIDNL